MLKKTINREAGDKTKGFLYQKLRAILLLLEKIKGNPDANILIAMEYKGDIFLKDDFVEYIEEDKNYTSKNFSFFSSQVLNTVVYFLEIWDTANYDPNIVFGFYSTNSVAKENLSKKIKQLGISTIPDKPILDLLQKKKWTYPNLLKTLKTVVYDEFKSQYKEDIETKFEENTLINFFNKIEWCFNQEDIPNLEIKIKAEIKNNHFFQQYNLSNRENAIFHSLMYELEKKQNISHITQRFINQDKIEVIFLREANRLSFQTNNEIIELRKQLNKIFEIQKEIYGEKYFITTEIPTDNI